MRMYKMTDMKSIFSKVIKTPGSISKYYLENIKQKIQDVI